MTTLTHPQGIRISTKPRRPSQVRAGASGRAVSQPGWLERLAAWADQQPSHRRLGSWMRFR